MAFVAPIIGNIAINLAVGIAASVLSNALAPKQKTRKVETSRGFSFDLQVGESVAVSAILGLGRARGQLIYVNEYGQDNEYVQLVIKVGHGWHDGMEAFLLDEKPVTFSGSNSDARGRQINELKVSGTPYGWVKYYTGAPGQTADAELVARANPSTRWTSAHKMTGCAYYILTFRYQADLFGSTLPLSGSIWRGLRLYDWREAGAIWGDQSTYVFTKNPAVIRYNFRRGIYVNGVRILGQGFSAFANDLAGYTAAANRCDEDFYDPETDTTFPVFEYGREVGDDEEKLAVLSELDAAYSGSSFKRGGADVPLPAQQLVSVLTLNDADRMRGYPVRADKKGSVSAKKTMWHGQFVSEDIGWALAPFTPRINTDLESVLGGRRSVAMDQPYEAIQQRAQLRAEIALRRQFYPAQRIETFTPKAFVLEPGDPVTRVCEWGLVLMVVEKVERVMVDGRWIAATVTLSEWNNAIVPASGDSFIDLPHEQGPGPADPNRTIVVSGLSVIPYQRQGGGAVHPFARATWTQITDPNVDQVMIRLWPADGTEANDHEDFFASALLTNTIVFGPLQPQTEYTGYAIPIRNDTRITVRTNLFTFTTGDEVTPIGDGAIDLSKVTDDIKAAVGAITSGDPGSVADILSGFHDRLEQLAAAVSDISINQDRRTVVIERSLGTARAQISEETLVRASETEAVAAKLDIAQAQIGNSIAAVVQEVEAVATDLTAEATLREALAAQVENDLASVTATLDAAVGPEGSITSQITDLFAKYNDVSAEGAVGFTVGVAPDGVTARYTVAIKVDDQLIAAQYLDVVPDGAGGYEGRVAFIAEFFYMLDTDGEYVSAPFAIEAGFTKITTVLFEHMESLDGSVVIEGRSGGGFTPGVTVG